MSSLTIVLQPLPAVVRYFRGLKGDWFLCREVAEATGVSTATLRRLAMAHPDLLAPSGDICFGEMWVAGYAVDDVARIVTYLAAVAGQNGTGVGRGRPRLWTEDERRDRRARYCAAAYRSRRARELDVARDHAAAKPQHEAAAAIRSALQAEHARRVRRNRRSTAGQQTARRPF